MGVRRRPEVAAWWRASGQRELRALLNGWDPIGVYALDPPAPPDEYDQYLAPVFRALREGGGVPEVRDALASALSSMGMGPAGAREDEVARRILAWWTASSPRG